MSEQTSLAFEEDIGVELVTTSGLTHLSTPVNIYTFELYISNGNDKMTLIQCACGCGIEIEDRDKYGRSRRYVNGHNIKGKHLSEEHRQKIREANRGKHFSEDHRRKMGKSKIGINNPMYGKHHSKETTQKISDALKGEKHPFYGKRHSEETLIKMRENHPDYSGKKNPNYGKSPSEEIKRRVSEALKGEKNPQWRGGKSFEPYCYKFNEALKEEIRENFGRVCFLCSKTEEENGRKLDVHHVDYNKEQGCNGIRWLLVPLCWSCNVRINKDREYWQKFISEKMQREGYLDVGN